MCGITGAFAGSELDLARLYAAHELLAHRGPDDEGFRAGSGPDDPGAAYAGDRTQGRWRELPHVATAGPARWMLGFHRLSILDLSENGHQPLAGRDERCWTVYNGEIYNYRELRIELERLGHDFRTETDTEVVARAFDQWGTECFARFNGMWAVAIYDTVARRLVLSRDRFGVKPLHYHLGAETVLFGSEIKFLAQLIELSLDETAAAEYLAEARVDHRATTFHPEVSQLPPAHFAVYDYEAHSLEVEPFWTLDDESARTDLSLDEAAEEFGALFDSAIDLRMRSDVPVGSLLSGGLDSTAIVTNLHARGRFPHEGFRSFSAVYREEAYSEWGYIEATAARTPGLIPEYVLVEPDELVHGLEETLRAQDAPFRSLAVYCQWLLYQRIRESSSVVVLLNGQGADEAFGGYTQHLFAALGAHAVHGRPLALARDAAWLRRHRSASVRSLVLNVAAGVSHALRAGRPSRRRTVTHPCFAWSPPAPEPVRHRDPFEHTLRSNLLFSALPEYLRYEDRNSMAASLETRLPFLDYRLVEWAFTIPQRLKVDRGESKRVVRRATAGYVPPVVASRTDKMGFTTPQEAWQRKALEPWIRGGIDRVDLDLLDRDRLETSYRSYAAGEGGDAFFWFRVACLGWWQEPARR